MEASLGFSILDLIINLDQHLGEIIKQFGAGVYFILFMVIFCETGLVVTPFLPGDSLLFVLGAFAANGQVDLYTALASLMTAAILGNFVNYQIGRMVGPKIFDRPKSRLFKKEYLLQTQAFYEKHGGKAVVIARFMPIFRTFVPFVAGIAQMNMARFAIYNIVGSVSWVFIFTIGGYLFGNIPFVQRNFTLVIIGVIFLSLLPGLIAVLRSKASSKSKANPGS